MSKVKNAFANAQTKFMCRMAGVPTEHGDHLLEVLGTIIIAVVILIFFRAQIIDLFNGAISNTTKSVNDMFTNVNTTKP